MDKAEAPEHQQALRPGPVYLTVLVIAACGLVYELLAATLASYLLGDSVTQFSLVIGVYLSSLGLGAWLSRFVGKGVARRFVEIEIAVALIGGFSAPALFYAFGVVKAFQPVFYSFVIVIGTLVGLEIPLMMRLLRSTVDFKELVAQVLTYDYLGALFASVLFPLLFVPQLGLVRTSLVTGLLNAAVALYSIHLFRDRLGGTGLLMGRAVGTIVLLAAGVVFADRLTSLSEENLYADEVVLAKSSPYQRIVITRNRAGFQLFLNNHLQFSSVDEYRYHEALVHPALSAVPGARRVLVCGGGDGLAVREILKHESVESITLVDLDPLITSLARENPLLVAQNGGALRNPKVTVVNADAMLWISDPKNAAAVSPASSGAAASSRFDVAIVDFPDPNSFAVGKLYTARFYALLSRLLAPGGAVVVQSTSPLFARESFWIVARTMEAAGFVTRPYHVSVPSFGEWGFVLAKLGPFEVPSRVPPGLRSLTPETLPSMFAFAPDMARPGELEVNRLNNQVLVHAYEREWRKFN